MREIALWVGVAVGISTFAWSAGESFALYGQLQRRARIGLVEPAVVNRVLLWGIGSLAAFAMSGYGAAGADRDGARRQRRPCDS